MTNQDKVKLILRKYPQTKYSRADFMWKYLGEFHGTKLVILKDVFFEFWQEFSGLERTLREVLKSEEFKPKPEQDSLRYKKASEFRQNYAKD